MRKMAYSRGNVIMPAVVQNQRYGPQRSNQLPKRRNGVAGGQNIVCVFQKQSLGVHVAGALTPCHGMAADKLPVKPCFFNMSVNISLDASCIGEQTAGRNIFFQLYQIIVIFGHRGAQKDIITITKLFGYRRKGKVDDPFPGCQFQSVLIYVVCHHAAGRMMQAHCPGNRAANQSKADKAAGKIILHGYLLLIAKTPAHKLAERLQFTGQYSKFLKSQGLGAV